MLTEEHEVISQTTYASLCKNGTKLIT